MMTRTMVLTLILAMPMAMAGDRNTARPSDKMREKLEIRIPKLSFQNARSFPSRMRASKRSSPTCVPKVSAWTQTAKASISST